MTSNEDLAPVAAIRAADDLHCVLDTGQRCVSVNDAFLQAFGRQESELLGQRITDAAGRDCIAELADGAITGALAGESASSKRWRDFPCLGFRYVRIDVEPLRDAAGEICGASLQVRDLTDARLAQEALEESEQRFDDFSEILADWLWELDENLRFVYLSSRFEEIMGLSREQVLGRRRIELFPEEDAACAATRAHHRNLEERRAFADYRFTRILDDGDKRSICMSGKPIFDGRGRFQGYRGIARDATETRRLETRVAHLASHDALTGLVNRQEFLQRLERVVETASEDHSEHGLCYVDVDRFRMVNDRCGHSAGDQLLKGLAELFRERIRRRDTLARVAGNSFTILMEHCSLSQIERVAEAVQRAAREHGFEHRDETIHFTVTISVVAIDAASRGVDRVLKAADRACYAAKSAGGDRILVHGRSDRQAARERRGERIDR